MNSINLYSKLLIKGLLTYFPGINTYLMRKGTGGTVSARYCYSVWLRHLLHLEKNGLNTSPKVVLELGPGDSIGVGLCHLLMGANTYYGIDVVDYVNSSKNINIFDELVELFLEKTNIPGLNEFPEIKPLVNSCEFPTHILTDSRIKQSLTKRRIDLIRQILHQGESIKNLNIKIITDLSGNKSSTINKNSIDFVYSQAVLEHVDDLEKVYSEFKRLLKFGGPMLHQIDFKSHNTSIKWNGHWGHSKLIWKIIKGNNKWLINRVPFSKHLNLLNIMNFNIVEINKDKRIDGIQRKQLSKEFKNLSSEDLTTSGVLLVSVKMDK